MAEVAVGNLIGKLIPLLKDEIMPLVDMTNYKALQDDLSRIQAELKDVDAKAEMADTTHHQLRVCAQQLRELAFRIEDAIDLYMFKVEPKRPQRQRHRSIGMLCKVCFIMRTVIPRHQFISDDFVNLRASIRRLEEWKQTLGLSPLPENGATNTPPALGIRIAGHFLEDDELVGADYHKSLLNDWLINGESLRTVISVVGEGGLGKTTIVKNVYNKHKNRSFECCAWINVSRSFQVEDLLKTLLQSLYDNDGNKDAAKEISEKVMGTHTLTGKLREYLKGRSYVIVFDDVWAVDFWGGVESALPANSNNRCRIIITTRHMEVAKFCQRSALVRIHDLKPLQEEDALNLFRLKTFQFDPQDYPEDLNDLAKSFVNKCEGLPLAIVVISGLLSTKRKNVFEWKNVDNNLRSKFSSDPHLKVFYRVLSESYYDLPYHLKLCLLCFGLFPEGHTITCTRLIRLWVVEGFVIENELDEDQTLEEAAEEYLDELIHRCLVKVSNVYIDGKVKSCRVHNLMHIFISKKCDELNFCQVVKSQFKFDEWTRRLSIHKGVVIEKDQNYGRVRSCMVCDIEQLPNSTLKSLLSRFRLLVTLDFENSPLDDLPNAIGNLLNLKSLSVRNTKIKTIPKFIGKLQKLETLNLKGTQVRELPIEINKLVKLRHLLSYSLSDSSAQWSCVKGLKLNKGLGALTALQKLVMVDTTGGDAVIRELGYLKNLRRLGIINLSEDNGNTVCNAIKNMPHLYSLAIRAVDEHEVLELQSLDDHPVYLRRLYLDGRLERLPKWIPKLKYLVKLGLTGSRLAEDPLPILKGLSELLELIFHHGSYEGEELHFKNGWFMKLTRLRLRETDGLKTLRMDEGALPNLYELSVDSIPRMVQMPRDIQNLQALKYLYAHKMPRQFVDEIPATWELVSYFHDTHLYIWAIRNEILGN